ncbi:hypothetical protein PV327_011737, partial [Microctonus hyperodae]
RGGIPWTTTFNNNHLLLKIVSALLQDAKKRGPYANEIDTAMQYIYSYLEQNSDECQFSLDELMAKIEGDYLPHIKTVKAQLLKKYGDDILIAITANKAPVVCFRNTGFKCDELITPGPSRALK